MAGPSLTVDEKLEALDRKFTDMMENMNAAMERLSRSVESIQTSSIPRAPQTYMSEYRRKFEQLKKVSINGPYSVSKPAEPLKVEPEEILREPFESIRKTLQEHKKAREARELARLAVINESSLQQNSSKALSDVSVNTCDVECMVSVNTIEVVSNEHVVVSDNVNGDACEAVIDMSEFACDSVSIVSEIVIEAVSIEGVNISEAVGFECEKVCEAELVSESFGCCDAQHVVSDTTCEVFILEYEKEYKTEHDCEGFQISIIGKQGKGVMGVMYFNDNAFPIYVSYLQDIKPQKFLILTFDPGLDSRTNPFEE